ncbi:MAG: P22 phage major capsid protein family protein [Candidatus Bathyarchaeia archaeon]
MANILDKNTSQLVLKKFVKGFMDDRVLLQTVNTQLIKDVLDPNTGSSVQLKRPHQYKAVRTPTGDMTGQANNIVSATVTANASEYITVNINYQQFEQALQLNQLDEILKPAHEEMTTELERETAEFMINNAGLTNGTPGTAISQWGDVAVNGSYLTSLGATGQSKNAAMNPFSTQELADTQSGLASGDNNLVNMAWREAQITTNFGGLKGFMSNSLGSYTTGTITGSGTVDATPTATYTALKDTYQMTIALAGFGAGATIVKGQQISFPASLMLNQKNKNVIQGSGGAAIPFIGTVLADAVADGTGDITVTISGAAIIDATNPQYNTVSKAITVADTVTVLAAASTTLQPGLFYTDEYVGVGTIDLPKLHGWDSSVLNVDGFSIRMTLYSDPVTSVQSVRFDLLPSFAVFNPMFGGQFFGQ